MRRTFGDEKTSLSSCLTAGLKRVQIHVVERLKLYSPKAYGNPLAASNHLISRYYLQQSKKLNRVPLKNPQVLT
jgi:hypothetical protein